jgi:hypothetical protein
MSFIEDLIFYKSAVGVVKKTITHDKALLNKDFIQSQFQFQFQFQFRKVSQSETPAIIILNTLKKVTLKIPDYKWITSISFIN